MSKGKLYNVAKAYISIIERMEHTTDPQDLADLEEQRVEWHNRLLGILKREGMAFKDREHVTRLAFLSGSRNRMNLETIARAYTSCVELEERLQRDCPERAGEASILRSDLHSLLMEGLRQAKIAFSDRSEAAQIAFEITQGKRKIA